MLVAEGQRSGGVRLGAAASRTRTTAQLVRITAGERLGLPVSLRDERLSSFVAESRLGRMPRGRSGGPPSRTQRNAFRARIDREAASVILQDELDARRFPALSDEAGKAGAAAYDRGVYL